MKVLIDTNVILDVLYNRTGLADASVQIFRYCEAELVFGYISALSIPNIIYVMRKELNKDRTCQLLTKLSTIFTICDLSGSDIIKAASVNIDDYEDALQYLCALRMKADYIVTRNLKDFKNSPIPAISPEELCVLIQGNMRQL